MLKLLTFISTLITALPHNYAHGLLDNVQGQPSVPVLPQIQQPALLSQSTDSQTPLQTLLQQLLANRLQQHYNQFDFNRQMLDQVLAGNEQAIPAIQTGRLLPNVVLGQGSNLDQLLSGVLQQKNFPTDPHYDTKLIYQLLHQLQTSQNPQIQPFSYYTRGGQTTDNLGFLLRLLQTIQKQQPILQAPPPNILNPNNAVISNILHSLSSKLQPQLPGAENLSSLISRYQLKPEPSVGLNAEAGTSTGQLNNKNVLLSLLNQHSQPSLTHTNGGGNAINSVAATNGELYLAALLSALPANNNPTGSSGAWAGQSAGNLLNPLLGGGK